MACVRMNNALGKNLIASVTTVLFDCDGKSKTSIVLKDTQPID